MSNVGVYTGNDFLNKQLPKREWLIEGLLKEKDALLWVGQEKSGKTLFSMQAFICCLTTGHPLIDKHIIPKPKKVTYILLEGDLAESQDRVHRLQKQLDIDPNNFCFMFLPRLMLHKEDGQYGLQHLISEIKKMNCHEVVIIDPLYRAFCGSLNDDNVVRDVVSNFDRLKDALNCALVIIHHTHKKKFDIRGKVITEGDEATFGSVWIKAWASQIVMQTYDQTTKLRSFYCQTQRGGDIIKNCNLKLIQPDPLYFMEDMAEVPNDENYSIAIIDLLKKPEYKTGLNPEEIKGLLHITKNGFYNSIKQPIAQGYILKSDPTKRPVKYLYNYEKDSKKGIFMEKTAGKEKE
jgi:archaellum biogenesis ATPase FlaH